MLTAGRAACFRRHKNKEQSAQAVLKGSPADAVRDREVPVAQLDKERLRLRLMHQHLQVVVPHRVPGVAPDLGLHRTLLVHPHPASAATSVFAR